MTERRYNIIVLNILLICSAHTEDGQNSTLTFVIDSTASMKKDIKCVTDSSEQIFDTVINSNTSGIRHFVIVVFNDPGYKLSITTNQKEKFKKSLKEIKARGGGDCPEMAMSGIELGLKSSRPFSYLFVFTDARAKDLAKLESVKNLALDLNTKVNFLISETVCLKESNPNFIEYETLARETGGEFFKLKKAKMPEILKYVKKLLETRKVEILHTTFNSTGGKVNVTLDSSIKDVIVSVSGGKPTIDVKDKHNTTVITEDVADTKKAKMVAWNNTEPGPYTIKVNCTTDSFLKVHGTSTVSFDYGFSVFKPDSMKETTNRPVSGQKTYTLIKLKTGDDKINLQRLQVVDLKDNVLLDIPMYIANERDQTYISEPTVFPKETFKLVMVAEDEKTKEVKKRKSLPIEPQKVLAGTIKEEAPNVSIMGDSKVITSYGSPLQLTCRVTGHPKPKVSWEDDFGSSLTFEVLTLKEEYEFISVLKIDKVNRDNTYTCKASNTIDADKKSVQIETENYFNVVNISKDTKLQYNKEGKLLCKVDAKPPANVTWYLNGKEVETDGDLDMSSDRSTLIIKSMKPKHVGTVICEVRNKAKRVVSNMQLSITGAEAPKIDKEITEISVNKGSSADVSCRILKGDPKPTLQWYYKSNNKDTFNPIEEHNEVIHIAEVSVHEIGTYKCIVTNEIDKDSHVVDLIIEYAPVLRGKQNINIIELIGQPVKIPCEIIGEPAADIKWFFKEVMIEDKHPYRIYKDNTLSFTASEDKMGQYSCEGVNKLGSVKKTADLSVYEPVYFDVPKETSFNPRVGSKLNLTCSAKGYPTPTIRWYHMDHKANVIVLSDTGPHLVIPVVQARHSGNYICSAKNSGDEKSLAFTINVAVPLSIKPIKKTLTAVEDDIVLRVQCEATGEPKPKISWIKDGKPLATGNDWYDTEANGILLIKNVKKTMEGSYACAAQDSTAIVYEQFKLNVDKFAKIHGAMKEEYLEINKPAVLECNVPHSATDDVRWYRKGRKFGRGVLKLDRYTTSDDGWYVCRVSNFSMSTTGSVRVHTGARPSFAYVHTDKSTFSFDTESYLQCTSAGLPKPKVSWTKDNVRLSHNDVIYKCSNKVSCIGHYECVVENKLGKIKKQFYIGSNDCLLDVAADFDRYHPLVLSETRELSNFYIKDEHLAIPVHRSAQFFCKGGFNKFSNELVKATCKENRTFEINKQLVDYRKLKCKEALQPDTIRTTTDCNKGRGEIVRIGVKVTEFLEVYQICLDKKGNRPFYAQYTLKASAAGVNIVPPKTWFDSDVIKYNEKEMYDCKKQKVDISAALGRPLSARDGCYVARQLVSEKDVSPGLPQMLTHSYLNIIPHWNSDNVRNWDKLEEILRNEVKARHSKSLIIRTGTSYLRPPAATSADIYIRDRDGNKSAVPVYLWKVITDSYEAKSVAIVQVNLPVWSAREDIHKYELCSNKCDKILWMNLMDQEYLKSGFMFCCLILDFEKAFKYYPLFNERNTHLLNYIS